MNYEYWLKKDGQKPLFPELQWEKPERQDQKGKLAIIGGTTHGFAAVAEAHQKANQLDIGQVRAVVPEALKSVLGKMIDDIMFAKSNSGGAFAREAEAEIIAAGEWADVVLFIGDTGRNSETALVYENAVKKINKPRIFTRDAIDLLKASPELLLNNEKNVLVCSFSQLQKLLRGVYFPRNIMFSMHLTQFVEVMHKVSLSFPALIAVYHSENLIIAHEGKVATVPISNPMTIWRGEAATSIAVNLSHHPGKIFEAAVESA